MIYHYESITKGERIRSNSRRWGPPSIAKLKLYIELFAFLLN